MTIIDLQKDLQKLKNTEKARVLQRFFKTGKGEYGEGDVFLGIVVPLQRQVARKYKDLSLSDLQKLLSINIHEYRLTALFILVEQFKRDPRKEIFEFYLKNTKYINNWDLVDLSSVTIIGLYLLDKDKKILYQLAKSKNMWERRMAVLACFALIRQDQFEDFLKISEMLLEDKEDLIHKAVGWMLREMGKKDLEKLEEFLKKYKTKMPRTMLRYAIEKFSSEKRAFYLQK